ncbi:VTT domain-containing protein [uncultured Vibrio sp.]|uniref:VTT domain-containing protein n=1 Tax=uncultured Vibrio sp. TaxID=114054 RepID=UPI002609097F|nr:VTT domain-containing protein [uncultured Vibrio sp.]
MNAIIKVAVWVSIVVITIFSIRWLNETYTLAEMRQFITDNQWYVLTGYAALISVRGLLFIPTMPFILLMASVVESWLLFGITLIASCCSAYLVCLAVDYLDFHKKLNALPSKSVKRAQNWINSMGVAAVSAWAFFPLVFTEIIVYLALLSGLTKRQLVVAVAIGEGLFIGLLTYLTDWVSNLVQY